MQLSNSSSDYSPGKPVRKPGLISIARAVCLSLFLWTAGIEGIQLRAESKETSLRARPAAGFSVKNFAALDLKGNAWRYEQLSGKVTIIHFWASWCAPCRKEIESLRRIDKKYGRQGLQILGINLDSFDRLRLVQFLAVHRIDWPQIHEWRGFDGQMAKLFGVDSMPGLFLIDCRETAVRLRASSVGSAAAKAMDACRQGMSSSPQ